jgi:hypothetical protein
VPVPPVLTELLLRIDVLQARIDVLAADAATRDTFLQGSIDGTRQSLEAHRAESRAMRDFVMRWIVQRVGPVVGGILAGIYAAK